MKSIKVRFNLSRGPNYMKWKVQHPDGTVVYCDPTTTQLVMHTCTLKNHRKTAEKILTGSHKTVCAWILCDSINIKEDTFIAYDTEGHPRVRYNPRVNPYWSSDEGDNVDNCSYGQIATVDHKLFVTKF